MLDSTTSTPSHHSLLLSTSSYEESHSLLHFSPRGNRRARRAALRNRAARSFAPMICGVALTASLAVGSAATAAEAPAASGITAAADAGKFINWPIDMPWEVTLPPRSTYVIGPPGTNLVKHRARMVNGAWKLQLIPQQKGKISVSIRPLDDPTVTYLINIGDESKSPGSKPTEASGNTPPVDVVAPITTTPSPNSSSSTFSPSLPPLKAPQSTLDGASLPSGMAPLFPSAFEPEISPILPRPSQLSPGRRQYPALTQAQLQVSRGRRAAQQRAAGRTINVTQGLARFLKFRDNVLTVFFSDDKVMDSRAINARTVSVSGMAPGRSTLAVFVQESPNDVIGRAEIWDIVVEPATPRVVADMNQNAGAIETAIRGALSDPRVAVRVIQRPDGALAVSLAGALHDAAEVRGSVDTAALFVPREQVISFLYLDPFAPSLAQALYPTTPVSNEQVFQAKLRQITGNNSIELISLPTGLAVKAEVDSAGEAEALLNLLPTLNQRVLPFIVIRGERSTSVEQSTLEGSSGKFYGAQRPILTGEDQEITRKLHDVTGIQSVSAVRTALNAIAVYGTVRDRIEYETVRRYLLMLPLIAPQTNAPPPTTGAQGRGGYSTPLLGSPVGNGNQNGAGGNGASNGAGNNAGALMSPQLSSNAQVLPGAGASGVTAGAPGANIGATGNLAGGNGAGGNGLPAIGTPGAGVDGTGGIGLTGNGGFVNGLPSNGVPYGVPVGTPNAPYGGPLVSETAGTSQSFLASQAAGFISNPEALTNAINAAAQPASGYRQNINVQMFVRILDPRGQSIRRITAETSIVEIQRSALRNIGVQAGSVGLLTEAVTQTAPTVVPGVAGTNGQGAIPPVVIPGTTQRVTTHDNTFRDGIFGGGESVTGALRNLDPLRLRLNALYQKGNARLLSSPNISAVEGAEAQITIGGERPVPSAVATGQAVGQSITFRRFGIILTMRPTVTDDDTIILQIRADVTELASEFGVTINGALIPGERVRSIDTVLNVREGDTIVLGGLISNERREQTSRIPFLSNIPILGKLFRSRRFENNESELAIFMTPRILREAASVNTKEAVQRVPGLPALRSNQGAIATFGLGATGGTGQ